MQSESPLSSLLVKSLTIAGSIVVELLPKQWRLKAKLKFNCEGVMTIAYCGRLDPSINIDTRVKWDTFCEDGWKQIVEANLAPQGVPQNVLDELFSYLTSAVYKQTHESTYDFGALAGCSGSKAFTHASTHPRLLSRTMAEFGSLVDDLKDLESLSNDQAIEACKQDVSSQGFNYSTYSWLPDRMYWHNSGSSHHAGRLCYLLKEEVKEWPVTGTCHNYKINPAFFSSEPSTFALYVMPNFEGMPYDRPRFDDKYNELGLHSFELRQFPNLQFVLINKTAPMSHISLQKAKQECQLDHMIRFDEMLQYFVD